MFGIDWQDVPADHMCQDCGREVYSPEGLCLYCDSYGENENLQVGISDKMCYARENLKVIFQFTGLLHWRGSAQGSPVYGELAKIYLIFD